MSLSSHYNLLFVHALSQGAAITNRAKGVSRMRTGECIAKWTGGGTGVAF